MYKYSEGDRNIRHLLRYGTYPAPPRRYRNRMGNVVEEAGIIGTHYEGEPKPRQMQKLPMFNFYYEEVPNGVDSSRPLGEIDPKTGKWVVIAGIALLALLFLK